MKSTRSSGMAVSFSSVPRASTGREARTHRPRWGGTRKPTTLPRGARRAVGYQRARLLRSGVAEQPREVLRDPEVLLLRVQRARHVIDGERIRVDQLVQLPSPMTTGTDDQIGHLIA